MSRQFAHQTLEAASTLCAECEIELAAVEQVMVRVKADSAETLGGRKILNHMRHGSAYPTASPVRSSAAGRASLTDFEEPAIHDPRVLTFMDRIRVVPDAGLTQFHVETGGFPARVEIVAKGALRAADRLPARLTSAADDP